MNLDNVDLAATLALFVHRLMDAATAAINVANMFALMGAIFFVATLLMRTIVPLRIAALISDVFFIAYGVMANSLNTFILYCLLLLKPFMIRRTYRKGDVLFRKGQPANEMFFTVSVKLLVTELGIEIPPGRLVGELGFLSPDNRRTQTVECIHEGEVLTMTYDRLLEIYFQNPEFGYYFLRLTSDRLLQNIARLEKIIEQSRVKDTNCN
jgi:Cyclic nucleotide-binding domain